MRDHPYETIAIDAEARSRFYRLCEKRIRLLKQHGFINEAILHAKALHGIKSDFEALDLYG